MKLQDILYVPERAGDAEVIEALNAAAFGPGRFARTAFRIRERSPHLPDLSFVALAGGELVGSVRLTGIHIGATPGLLLGPLVVAPPYAGRGIGRTLVRVAADEARSAGHRLLLLVGDAPYYGPLGFRPLPGAPVRLPGPADPARILVAELQPGATDGLSGEVRAP